MKNDDAEKILKELRKKQFVTIDELHKTSNYSIATLRRRLKQWRVCTSYNQNGRYYTLFETAQFNQYGIWHCKHVFFSRYGALTNTVLHLIEKATAGLNVSEMNKIIRIPSHDFLSRFYKNDRIKREKYNGVYVYFSKESVSYDRQKRMREGMNRQTAKELLPSDYKAIIILSQYAQHPEDALDALTRRVRRKGSAASVTDVRNLLVYHELLKKTPDYPLLGHSINTLND